MADANNHEARISVLETEMRATTTGHRDVWDELKAMRNCMISSMNEIRKDVASTKLWMVVGVLAAVLPAAGFMLVKLMGW